MLLSGCDPDGVAVAISRVAMVSATEGWVEGIRVDPRVRGLGIATDLQTAELYWLAAHKPDVVRYATGARNEGSHRLGARHGFELLARYQTWRWKDPETSEGSDDRPPSGFDEPTRLAAVGRRHALLDQLARAGLIAASAKADAVWSRLLSDAGFEANGRLYERRSWTMQELTRSVFEGHIAAREVCWVETNGGWALAILTADAPPAEDVSINLSVLAGTPTAAAALASQVQRLAGESVRLRLEVGSVGPVLSESLNSAGFEAWPWELHILGRPFGPSPDLPPIDPRALVLTEEPAAVITPPR